MAAMIASGDSRKYRVMLGRVMDTVKKVGVWEKWQWY